MGGLATELTLTAVPTPNIPRYPVGSPPGVDMAHRGEALAAGAEAGTGGVSSRTWSRPDGVPPTPTCSLFRPSATRAPDEVVSGPVS